MTTQPQERDTPELFPDETINQIADTGFCVGARTCKIMASEIRWRRAQPSPREVALEKALEPFKEALAELDGDTPPDLQADDAMPIGDALWDYAQPTCGDLRRLITALSQKGETT